MRALLHVLFALGLVLKLLHLPYHTVFLLAVVFVLIAQALNGLVRRTKDHSSGLVDLAIALWLLHAVALLKLFPIRPATMVLAVVATVAALIAVLRTNDRSRPGMVPLLLVLVVVLLVQAAPTPARYHFTNLRFSLERSTDASSWDKYSFLLLRDGDREAALAACDSARAAAQRSGRLEWLTSLEQHRAGIEQDTWDRYHPLSH